MSETSLFCADLQATGNLADDPMLLDADGRCRVAEESAATIQSDQFLLRQQVDFYERERERIAYEFHDRFAQQLTGALMNLQAYGAVGQCNPAAAEEMLKQAMALVSASIDDARRMISRLHPPVLDESGIVVALEYLACEKAEGPPIELACDVHFERLIRPLELALYRIAQEAVANARQSSGSHKIRIALSDHDDRVVLSIRDWGSGFEAAPARPGHYGLENMRHRARLLGGKTMITSAPGQGTLVTTELPLIRAANGRPFDEPEV